jgi:hypothetical protein
MRNDGVTNRRAVVAVRCRLEGMGGGCVDLRRAQHFWPKPQGFLAVEPPG